MGWGCTWIPCTLGGCHLVTEHGKASFHGGAANQTQMPTICKAGENTEHRSSGFIIRKVQMEWE
jgi:hypothetical protein